MFRNCNHIQRIFRRTFHDKKFEFNQFDEKKEKLRQDIEFSKRLYSTLLVPVFIITTPLSIFSAFEIMQNYRHITMLEVVVTGVTIGTAVSITYPISYPFFTFYTLSKFYKSCYPSFTSNVRW